MYFGEGFPPRLPTECALGNFSLPHAICRGEPGNEGIGMSCMDE